MRKSQSSLEYLFNYGWVILIAALIGGVLYYLGIFNPSQSTATVVSGLSYFEFSDAVFDSNGSLFLQLGSKTGVVSEIKNIDYYVEGHDCFNNIDEADFDISPSAKVTLHFLPSSACGLEENQVITMNVSVTYTRGTVLEHTDKGTIRILVHPIVALSGNYSFFMSGQSEFDLGVYENTTYGSVMLSGSNTSGTYFSKVFDFKTTVHWINITWNESLSYGEEYSLLEGAVGWWHMNEGKWTGESDEIKESSGNDLPLTAYNGAATTSDARFSRAGVFDGKDDYLSRKYAKELNPETWTIEAWIKPETFDYPSTIVEYDIYYQLNIDHARIQAAKYSGTEEGWKYATGTTEMPLNSWSHVAGTWDGRYLKVYLNGKMETQTMIRLGTIIEPKDPPFVVAMFKDAFYTGGIDELIIYDRALEDEELLEHYMTGALNLTLWAKSCDDSECLGESWSNYFSMPGSNHLNLSDSQYFQYKFDFLTEDINYSPILNSVRLNYEVE